MFRYMRITKQVLLLLSLLFLISCVTNSNKVDVNIVEKVKKINIDSDIEDEYEQALSYLKATKYDQAISILLKLIAVEKQVPAPYVNLAMAYDKKGDKKQAESYYLQALKIDLTHPIANNELGLLYRRAGRFNDAKKAYTNALTKYPDYLPVVKNLGILCDLYMHDFSCAMEQYKHYQDLRPDDKIMKIWIADLNQRIK